MKARRILVRGIVQGVGFRPHVYRLATSLGLAGHVRNDGRGVEVLVEGSDEAVDAFVLRLEREPPPMALIEEVASEEAEASGLASFKVVRSRGKRVDTLVPHDLSICPECARELFDPANRRYQYPLINCMNCGPRFSIIRSLPYDRMRTSMSAFKLCRTCTSEYSDPSNRRFRAEPISCPICGPQVWYERQGKALRAGDPIGEAAGDIDRGRLVAIKGIGGFHLAADATNDSVVSRLRRVKRRHLKPFAMMVRDMASVHRVAHVTETERDWLSSRSSPIVLLRKRKPNPIAPSVAPNMDTFGVMLPYTGIHMMLLAKTSSPFLIMTSGNPKDEVIAHENAVARRRLSEMADSFLMHNRSILNFEDDSVVRIVDEDPVLIRRSRGYAPIPVKAPLRVGGTLGMGGDLKNTFSLGKGDRIFVSQHTGDLDSARTVSSMKSAIRRLTKLIGGHCSTIAHDMHPGYRSTDLALSMRGEKVPVQHHHAHLVSSAASNGVADEILGLACDGTGYGLDGQVWGFEMAVFSPRSFERIGTLSPFRLPGSDSAVLDPRRTALSLLLEALGEDGVRVDVGLTRHEEHFISQMVKKGINSPLASSCGRLFDAVSAITGICRSTTYEGQPAMELEAASRAGVEDHYPFELSVSGLVTLDHRPIIRGVVEDVKAGTQRDVVAARFHNTMVEAMAEMLLKGHERVGGKRIALGGGSFCNSIMVRGLNTLLRSEGFTMLFPKLLPPNDGGISYGQVVIAAAR